MTVDMLMAELEWVTYSERVQRMATLGRAAGKDADVAALLQTLWIESTIYPRYLGLLSCYGSRNGGQVLQALSDPSRLLRGLAVKLVPIACTAEQAVQVLEEASPKMQKVLLRGLVRRRRQDAIDSFLRSRVVSDRSRFNELLPYGSEEIVREFLEDAIPMFGVLDWARLARRHPIVTAEAMSNVLRQQTQLDPRMLSYVNAVIPELVESQPQRALDLVREALEFTSPARLALQRLAERKPNEVADILLRNAEGASAKVDVGSVARRLSRVHLVQLLKYRPSFFHRVDTYLPKLSPELRRVAFEVAEHGWRDSEGRLPTSIVALLPKGLREPEARRNLTLPRLATRPLERLKYAAFLPWDEASEVLRPFIRNPDAGIRAVALEALIGSARYHPERLDDVLAEVANRSNEQDPVRGVALSAIASLPPSRWQANHLDRLGQILQDVLNASDLSHQTVVYMETLIVGLVPFYHEWAAIWLKNLVKSRGLLSLHTLGHRLTDADVRRIAPALVPVFESWETRERERFILQAANGLGRRLQVFDAFAELLKRLLESTRDRMTALHLLTLIAKYRSTDLPVLVLRLLEKDASTITLPVVYEFLHRKRQDLLTPYLGQRAYSGRFSTGKTRFVLPLRTGFHRWTPTQQERFAYTLTEITKDTKRDTPAILQAMSQLAALQFVPPTRLVELAASVTEKTAVRDAALHGLARLDAGQGIPILVEALGDNRARVAIYALSTALLEMPTDRALALLKSVPTNKVTVAKEVVRLLGELNTTEAYSVLLEMAQRVPSLHRDVRVALLRALWDHIEHEETWPILNQAAADADTAIAMGVVKIPTERISPLAQQRLLYLMAILLRHPDATLRVAALTQFYTHPLTDSENILLPSLLASLASSLPDEYIVAARVFFLAYRDADLDSVRVGIETVRTNRHALVSVLGYLRAQLNEGRIRWQPVLRAVLGVLENDSLTVQERVTLAIAGLPWADAAAYLIALSASNALHPDALVAAEEAIEKTLWQFGGVMSNQIVNPAEREAIDELALLEKALFDQDDPNLRRLALSALIGQTKGKTGWTDSLRARLDVYRSDPAPLVAAAAQFTILPLE